MLEYVPGALQGDPPRAPEARLRALRDDRAGAGAERGRSPAAWPVRGCWRTCWWPSTPITCRCTGRARSTPARASIWTARRWPTGSAARARCSSRWSRPLAATCSRPTSCTPTTRRCRCCARAAARPRPGGCGPTCATTGRPAAPIRRRCCSATRPDRKGEHPRQHLKRFRGILQADGYAGFDRLYGERIQEAACWAHVRRKFYDLHDAHASPLAAEALDADRRALRDRGRDPRPAAR